MKRFLIAAAGLVALATPALAADMAPAPVYTKAPPPPVVAVYNWTGCYLGVEGGGAWGNGSVVDAEDIDHGAPVAKICPTGGLAGGTVGCNYQVHNFVVGIENDISWSGLRGTSGDLPPFTATFSHSVSTSWLDTLRGRAGITFDRALFYVTGGAAFSSINNSATGGSSAVSITTGATGWTVGGGVEYMFTPQWTVKAEYLYVRFPTIHDAFGTLPPIGTYTNVDTHLTENIVRVGLNYKFGWGGPVVAKY